MADITELHPSMGSNVHGPVARFRADADRVVGQLRADVDQPTAVQQQWRRIRFALGRALVFTLAAMLAVPVLLGYLAVLGPIARWVGRRWGLDW